MKTRKLFLDGYVQYVPKYFKSGSKEKAFALITKDGRGVFLSRVALAKANIASDNAIIGVDVLFNETESKFALVVNEEGQFSLRSYQKGTDGMYSAYQMTNTKFIEKLKEMGFESGIRYKVEVPEDGVIIVKKEI